MRSSVQMRRLSVYPRLRRGSSAVFVSQGVVGKSAPQVLPPGGKGHGPLSAGGGAGVGPQHEKSSTEHVPDLPHGLQTGISPGGEA